MESFMLIFRQIAEQLFMYTNKNFAERKQGRVFAGMEWQRTLSDDFLWIKHA